MSEDGIFRSSEQEVQKLLDECQELRRTLQSISAQVGRMEGRLKKAFPHVKAQMKDREKKARSFDGPTMSAEQALAEFEGVVRLASTGRTEEAERALNEKSAIELLAIAKEVGVTFSKSRPSVRAMREAISGKVRESILLSRHSPRSSD